MTEDAARARRRRPRSSSRTAHEIFAARCVGCHTADGRGLIGPNLTDTVQLHGTTRMDIYKTITRRRAGHRDAAWGEQLPATDVVAVATFVITLRGKNVPAARRRRAQPRRSAFKMSA